MPQINHGMPAGIVFAMAMDNDVLGALPELAQSVERANHFLFSPHDPDEVLHQFLQIVLHPVRTFGLAICSGGAVERFQSLARGLLNLSGVNTTSIVFLGKNSCEFARALAEDKQVGQ